MPVKLLKITRILIAIFYSLLVSNLKDWHSNAVLEEKKVRKKKPLSHSATHNEIPCHISNRTALLIIKHISNYLKERNGNNLLVLQ